MLNPVFCFVLVAVMLRGCGMLLVAVPFSEISLTFSIRTLEVRYVTTLKAMAMGPVL